MGRADLGMTVVEKLPIAALLQKVQTLTYQSLRFDRSLFLLLAFGVLNGLSTKTLSTPDERQGPHVVSDVRPFWHAPA